MTNNHIKKPSERHAAQKAKLEIRRFLAEAESRHHTRKQERRKEKLIRRAEKMSGEMQQGLDGFQMMAMELKRVQKSERRKIKKKEQKLTKEARNALTDNLSKKETKPNDYGAGDVAELCETFEKVMT